MSTPDLPCNECCIHGPLDEAIDEGVCPSESKEDDYQDHNRVMIAKVKTLTFGILIDLHSGSKPEDRRWPHRRPRICKVGWLKEPVTEIETNDQRRARRKALPSV